GRPATACRARTGDRARARGVPDGRAAVEPRRKASRPDAGRDSSAAATTRDDDDLRDARSGGGDDDGRSHRGHEPRRPAADRQSQGHEIVALVPSDKKVKAGDNVAFAIPVEKLHVFDPDTELSLTAQR